MMARLFLNFPHAFKFPAHAGAALVLMFATPVLSGCDEMRDSEPEANREAVPAQESSAAEALQPTERAGAEGTEEAGEHRMEGGAEGEHRGEEGEEHAEVGEHEGDGEHGEHAEHGEHGEEGEESGEYIGRGESWDATRRGMRLNLSFDPAEGAFEGTVENTTQATVCDVRVEVHLAGGSELGPTEGRDLAPGETATFRLPTGGESFELWTAHPESSSCGVG